LANTRSAIKTARQSERRRHRNRAVRSKVRSTVKTARAALVEKTAAAAESVAEAIRVLDKAVTKGIVHKNTAARKKSRLMKQLAPR